MPAAEPTPDVTIFFVVQPGSLSLRGRFLAASLRALLPESQPIHAFLPTRCDLLDRATRRFLDAMAVEVRPFEAELWSRYDYPIGNKLDAARQGFPTRHALFLDTDILCLAAPPLSRLTAHSLAATGILGASAYAGANAARLDSFAEERFGITLRPQRDRRGKPSPGLVLFNSGVVGFDASAGLAEQWHEATVALFESDLPDAVKHPYADQTSLALVAAMRGDETHMLARRWNHPPRFDDKGQLPRSTIFLHYFRFPSLLRSPSLSRRLIELHRQHAEAGGHNLLGELTPKDLYGFWGKAAAEA